MKKRAFIMAGILCSLLTAESFASALPANEETSVYVNGSLQVEVLTVNNRTLVQLATLNDPAWNISYDSKKKTVVVSNPSNKKSILLKAGEKSAEVNGKKVAIDAPVTVKEGRTYVPLRLLSEQMGGYVSFNKEENRAVIRTPSGQANYETLMSGDLAEARDVASRLELVYERGTEPLPVTGEGFTTTNAYPKGEALRLKREYKGMTWYAEVNKEGLLIVKWQKDSLDEKNESGTPPKSFGEGVFFSDNFMSGLLVYGTVNAVGELSELGRIDLAGDGDKEPSLAVPIEGESREDAVTGALTVH
ncbi:copper amine oxidase N-terminal domain-containing protein [Fontibacillus phaseoli]|uniref:copper amine oxidase N-terminal domain-containing protein n=1 Tax=Fontibacillus phaseoli TaxID=1416533 RepID=UPI0015F0554D|nr:copper amine oxidase N-terminal domain-containing protein [Fontibacillus phaseoli]